MDIRITRYKQIYDDPYIMCACSLIAHNNPADIRRIMVDDDFIRRMILKETRATDFRGAFLDAIIQTVLEDKRRMEMMAELDKLSLYFYQNLDIHRLREVIEFVDSLYNFGILAE